MSLKVLDMCDTQAQGSMLSAQPGMLAVSRRLKVPSDMAGNAAWLPGGEHVRHCSLPRPSSALPIEPGVGRTASSAQALSW